MSNKYKLFEFEEFKIHVAHEVLSIWNEMKQNKHSKKEACGVIIGGYDQSTKTIFIEECTRPMKNDDRKKYSFTLKDRGHQKAVNDAFASSQGKTFYLGIWHTHPEASPSPSISDKNDWQKCIKRNSSIPVFTFVIVGTKNIYFFAGQGESNAY